MYLYAFKAYWCTIDKKEEIDYHLEYNTCKSLPCLSFISNR